MFSASVVTYLFLGGAAGGACLVLGALGLLVPRDALARPCSVGGKRTRWAFSPSRAYRRLFVSGYSAAIAALGVGILCLLVDLGRADRVLLLFSYPAVTFVSAGAWALALCAVVACIALWLWVGGVAVASGIVRAVQAASAIAGAAVMLYSGLLLQDVSAVPLWASPWLPALFAFSSLSCGVALVALSSLATGASRAFCGVMRRMLAVDALVIVLEAACAACLIAPAVFTGVPGNPTQAALCASADALLFGADAWAFWSGFCLCGLAVPFVLDVVASRGLLAQGVFAAASACVLIGGFALRYCLVAAGMHPVVGALGCAMAG